MSTLLKRRFDLPAAVEDFFETGRMFPGIFDFNSGRQDRSLSRAMPPVNVIESPKDFKIEMVAPGLEKKDFKIEVDNGLLTISAEKEEEKNEEKKNYSRQEFSYSSFIRSFTLPENVLANKIDAQYAKGVLELTIPKKEVTLSTTKKEIKVT